MAVNFNGTSLVASNTAHNINFNGCTVCTVLQDGKFVFDRQDTSNLNMLYGCDQHSVLATDAWFVKPARYVCLPTSITKGYQLWAANDGFTAYCMWADIFFQMHSNIRIDSGTWRHIYANGGCPLCYSVVGRAAAYFCGTFCAHTNFNSDYNFALCNVSQSWSNLWTCWKPFTATPTICLCNPNIQATMRTPIFSTGYIWGAFDGTYVSTAYTCIIPLDSWVAYQPQQLVVCYSAGVSRTFNIANNGCCPGATAWINMCFD